MPKRQKRYFGMTIGHLLILSTLFLFNFFIIGVMGFIVIQNTSSFSNLQSLVISFIKNSIQQFVAIIFAVATGLITISFTLLMGISRSFPSRYKSASVSFISKPSDNPHSLLSPHISGASPRKAIPQFNIFSIFLLGFFAIFQQVWNTFKHINISRTDYTYLNHDKPVSVRSYRRRDGTLVRAHSRNYRR